jgi:hypothetical protein
MLLLFLSFSAPEAMTFNLLVCGSMQQGFCSNTEINYS